MHCLLSHLFVSTPPPVLRLLETLGPIRAQIQHILGKFHFAFPTGGLCLHDAIENKPQFLQDSNRT